MSGRQFGVVAIVGLGIAALSLALAQPLHAPALYFVGVLAVLVVLGARTAWRWRGRLPALVQLWAALGAVIAVAFVLQKVAG
jgi:hypothetical protein